MNFKEPMNPRMLDFNVLVNNKNDLNILSFCSKELNLVRLQSFENLIKHYDPSKVYTVSFEKGTISVVPNNLVSKVYANTVIRAILRYSVLMGIEDGDLIEVKSRKEDRYIVKEFKDFKINIDTGKMVIRTYTNIKGKFEHHSVKYFRVLEI